MNITREEALLIPEITQRIFDILSVNLRMEATWVKDGGKFEWVAEVNKKMIERIFSTRVIRLNSYV